MKMLITSAVLMTLAAAPTLAADPHADDPYRNTKAGFVFGNAIAGTIIAGPIGGAAAALVGIWTSGKVIDGYEKEAAEAELADVRAENMALQQQFAMLNVENIELQNLAASSLEFQVLFHTGNSALAAESAQRIARLAQFLAQQGSLQVRLSGFADPRGDDAFNEALSQQRVDSITAILTANGVDPARISSSAFGDRLSTASKDDYDAYALERRVSIELVPDVSATNLAATN